MKKHKRIRNFTYSFLVADGQVRIYYDVKARNYVKAESYLKAWIHNNLKFKRKWNITKLGIDV